LDIIKEILFSIALVGIINSKTKECWHEWGGFAWKDDPKTFMDQFKDRLLVQQKWTLLLDINNSRKTK
jgi:hypothetical protein